MQIIIKKTTLVLGNPYITDGLVAQFDGIWNAELGRHDAEATEWTNLVTGEQTISTAENSFSDDALSIQPINNSINLNSPAAVNAISSGEFTIEVVGFIEAFTPTRFFWIADAPQNSSASNICLMTHSSSGLFILSRLGDVRNVVSHGTDTAPCTGYGNIIASLGNQVQHNVSFYKDGVLNTRRKCTTALNPTNLFINVFATGPVGKYHALRIYNRPLSEAEITTNCEIDKARFHF